jgi:hypothetical protein
MVTTPTPFYNVIFDFEVNMEKARNLVKEIECVIQNTYDQFHGFRVLVEDP